MMLARIPFESSDPVWSVSHVQHAKSTGIPTAFAAHGPECRMSVSCRFPQGTSKVVQVFEVLFRILLAASLHLQVPKDQKSLSNRL